MTIDQNEFCYCGSGQKIKHCCGKVAGAELEKVVRAIEGDQRFAAMNHLDAAISKHGPLPCLLSLKVQTQVELQQFDEVKSTLEQFLEAAPESIGAQSYRLLFAVKDGNTDEMMDAYQAALRAAKEAKTITDALLTAIGAMTQLCFETREYFIARGCLLWGVSVHPDGESTKVLMELERSPAPALVKDHPIVGMNVAEDAVYGEEFAEAVEPAFWGIWSDAVVNLHKLDEKYPNEEPILRSIALSYSYLNRRTEAVEAWNRLAALPQLAHEDQVEAAAIARLLLPQDDETALPYEGLTFEVKDFDETSTALIAHARALPHLGDPREFAVDENPPPRHVFDLVEQEVGEYNKDAGGDQWEKVVGRILLFGKETNREARLEFHVLHDHNFDSRVASLRDVLGDSLGEATSTDKLLDIPESLVALNTRWRYPEKTPQSARAEMAAAQLTTTFSDLWATHPQSRFGNQSPRDAAKDAKYRLPLLAEILWLECLDNDPIFDFNTLREDLGLPIRATLAVGGSVDAVRDLRPSQLKLLPVDKLSSDQLLNALRRAMMYGENSAIRLVGNAILGYDSMKEMVAFDEIHQMLAQASQDPEVAIDHLQKARNIMTPAGKPIGMLLFQEMQAHLMLGNQAEAEALMKAISTRHIEEPGVRESMMQFMMAMGVDPRQGAPGAGATAAPGAAVSIGADAAAPGAATGGVWSPDAPAPAEEGGDSKLWVPGMD